MSFPTMRCSNRGSRQQRWSGLSHVGAALRPAPAARSERTTALTGHISFARPSSERVYADIGIVKNAQILRRALAFSFAGAGRRPPLHSETISSAPTLAG